MREVFTQAPPGEREGAYALGATKWGMIRAVVLPYGTGGIIGGTMLGLGRALGETIAVYLIISPVFVIQPHILQNGGSTRSRRSSRCATASRRTFGTSALMAAGLALFVLTLIINFVASPSSRAAAPARERRPDMSHDVDRRPRRRRPSRTPPDRRDARRAAATSPSRRRAHARRIAHAPAAPTCCSSCGAAARGAVA